MVSSTLRDKLSKHATSLSIVSVIAMFVSGLVIPKVLNWFFVVGLMICFVAFIGLSRTSRLSGIFINERNLMSLSRFQLVIWSIIVLSAFLTIALLRISAHFADPAIIVNPLDITVPDPLWTLLGISTASLVGSPLLLSTKLPKTPEPSEQKEFVALKVAKYDKANSKKIAETIIAEKGKDILDKDFELEIFSGTTIPDQRNLLLANKGLLKSELEPLYLEERDLITQRSNLNKEEEKIRADLATLDAGANRSKFDQTQKDLNKKTAAVQTLTSRIENIQREIKDKESEMKEIKDSQLNLNNIVDGVKKIRDGTESKGTLNFNADINDAKFSDMFQGDEEGNCKHIDMAKVQMFFFTLIVAFSYMVLLVNLILNNDAKDLGGFPELSDGLVALLGISTGGYLGNKAGDKTKTV